MWPFKYPYTNFHELNLDWILEIVKNVDEKTNGIYDYIEKTVNNAIASIDIDQKTIDEITKYGTVYTNANALGVKPNDENAAKNNSEIVNNALKNGKYLYFPIGSYYFNDTIHIVNNSGIIGENIYGTAFITSAGTGIEIDFDYDVSKPLENFTICCLRDIGLFGRGSNRGLYFNNRFFTETCDSNHETYKLLKGDGYALELRQSPIENLYISSFVTCIDSTYYTAVATLRNMFISDASGTGFINHFADSNFENIFITYCNTGLYTNGDSNKFNNIKIYMCGRNYSGETTGKIGCEIYSESHSMFTNFEAQENYSGGILVIFSNNILIDCIVDSNCFKSTAGVGIEFQNSNHISGRVIALNKNADKTQVNGIYLTNCTDINIDYMESEQKSPVNSHIKSMLNTTSITEEIVTTPIITGYNYKTKIRNNTLYISGLTVPSEQIPRDVKIVSFDKNIGLDADYVIPFGDKTAMLKTDGIYSREELPPKDYAVSFSMPL